MSFSSIFSALESDLSRFSGVISSLESLASHFTEDYMRDGNLRDAAIDDLISYLQTLKTKK